MQQLRDHEVRDLIVDRRAEEDDPLVEQAAVDVERTLTARRLLDHHGDKWAHDPRFGFASAARFLPSGKRKLDDRPICAEQSRWSAFAPSLAMRAARPTALRQPCRQLAQRCEEV